MIRFILTHLLGIVCLMPTTAFSQATPQSQECLVLLMLGPPGSGKGTQAVRLSQHLTIPHISTGDLFRANIKNKTALGHRVKGFLDAGKLVPDSLVLDMLFDRLKAPDCKNGFLLDGFPRTVAQAKSLDSFLKEIKNARVVVLQLLLSDDLIVRRIAGRRTCQSCGRVYHIEASSPKETGICDFCHSPLIQRSDDKAEVVKERLKAYHDQTKPVEEYYRKKGVVQQIDGSLSPDAVFEAMQKILK